MRQRKTRLVSMYHRLKLLIVFLSLSSTVLAQNHGSIEIEVGGVGGFGSVSYRKSFKSTNHFTFAYRAGLSFVPIDANNGFGIVVPVLVHLTYGKNRHFLDVGLGQGFTVTSKGNVFARLPISLGYQFDNGKRMYYRAAYTPLVSYIYNFQWEHWAGITIGVKLGSL